MADFYFRAEDDPNYKENIFESSNDIENTISQVRMTLLTKKGEVLGEPNFGLDPTKYLFEFEGFPMKVLEREAVSQISDFVTMSRIYEIVPTVFQMDDLGDPHRVALALDVSINGKRTFAALFED